MLWLSKSDPQTTKWTHISVTWKTEEAVATEVKRAQQGLDSYQLRGIPGELIARAVKSAAATNEKLDISRTTIMGAEYRLLDLHELKLSRGMGKCIIDLPAVEALEKRGPVAPLYCVKLACSPPWPHLIELGFHSETGDLICQIDNAQKFPVQTTSNYHRLPDSNSTSKGSER